MLLPIAQTLQIILSLKLSQSLKPEVVALLPEATQ